MPKRRQNKVRSDGRYRVKYHDQQFYGSTYAEAVRKMEDFKKMEARGLKKDSDRRTVRGYALKWLPINKASVSDKTYNDYANLVNIMVDYIGEKVLMDVTPSDIKEIYSKQFINYSQSTIHRAAMLYKAIFESAKEDGLCLRNPCTSKQAKPHKGTSGSHRAITDEERSLIQTVPHRFQAAAMVMLYAGLRRGEALAIDLDKDIDRSTSVPMIMIRHAARFEHNQPVVGKTKTESGVRSVPVFDILGDFLSSNDIHGVLLQSKRGDPCSETAFRNGWKSYMDELTKAAGHPVSIRPHDLRHSYCTMLRDAGVDMHLAMQWMGHSDEKMILQIYDHITEKRVQNAVKNVQKFIFGVQNGVQNDSDP